MLTITDIKIRKILTDSKLKAIISITIDGEFAVHDIKIVQKPDSGQLFVAMPSRKDENGIFRDIAHPISMTTRQSVEAQILDAYERYIAAAAADIEE